MIYFAISAVICFGVYEFLPETNGVTKEEIEELEDTSVNNDIGPKDEARLSLITYEIVK
jgi:hypothetical protein